VNPVTVGDNHEADVTWLAADGNDGEPTAMKRVRRIGNCHVLGKLPRPVVERGINVLARSTLWTTHDCASFSSDGYAMVWCYA